MNSISFAQVDAPLGDGATITALRALRLLMILFAGVAAGLVEGVTAQTTPTGRPISMIPRALSSDITPTVFMPRKSLSRPRVLRWFLRTLSSTSPIPVSRTASSARARLRPGSRIAQPAAATSSSTRALVEPSATFCAARARATRSATIARRATSPQVLGIDPLGSAFLMCAITERSTATRGRGPRAPGSRR
jgi:hypothetical protein